MDVTITGLYHYPIKSCAGVGLAQCAITPKGITGDREWMIINSEGLFVTQRKLARMALIRVRYQALGLCLYLSDPQSQLAPCPVPMPTLNSQRKIVQLWKDTATAFLADDAVNQWITQALQSDEPLFLAYFDKSASRMPGHPERFGSNATYFADAAPFLIANALSLYALNLSLTLQDLPEVDIRHFRPNIVFSGLPGFAEHHIKALKHTASGIEFKLVDPCQRCSIITLNPDNAERLPNAIPFKQLTAINPMPHSDKAPAFGMNASLTMGDHEGEENLELNLGDKLEVIQ